MIPVVTAIRAWPVWLVGFRPFFTLGAVLGLLLPVIWAAIYTGHGALPNTMLSPQIWHAHEMFYGFGGAILGGFLLTSTKNWVSIRGYHGQTLMGLVLLWCLSRLAVNLGADWPAGLYWPAALAFQTVLGVLLMVSLIRYRAQDSYSDNAFFVFVLLAFPFAQGLLLGGHALGVELTLALFRLAFLLMLERTLTQFMKGAFQVAIYRAPWLDMSIKGLAAALVCVPWIGTELTSLLATLLGALLLYRFARWYPLKALQRIEIGIMYVAYLAITVQLFLMAYQAWVPTTWVGSVSVHVFTFGAMGCAIPAMILRIAQGHTGRKIVFTLGDKAILGLMALALFVRVVLPQLGVPYTAVIHLSATLWALTYAHLLWHVVPYLFQARVDGREH